MAVTLAKTRGSPRRRAREAGLEGTHDDDHCGHGSEINFGLAKNRSFSFTVRPSGSPGFGIQGMSCPCNFTRVLPLAALMDASIHVRTAKWRRRWQRPRQKATAAITDAGLTEGPITRLITSSPEEVIQVLISEEKAGEINAPDDAVELTPHASNFIARETETAAANLASPSETTGSIEVAELICGDGAEVASPLAGAAASARTGPGRRRGRWTPVRAEAI